MTAQEIVDSPTWALMIETLAKSYFERFLATDPSDVEALIRQRDNLEALHAVDRELHALAREGTHTER